MPLAARSLLQVLPAGHHARFHPSKGATYDNTITFVIYGSSGKGIVQSKTQLSHQEASLLLPVEDAKAESSREAEPEAAFPCIMLFATASKVSQDSQKGEHTRPQILSKQHNQANERHLEALSGLNSLQLLLHARQPRLALP
jgi:hypothetical protein